METDEQEFQRLKAELKHKRADNVINQLRTNEIEGRLTELSGKIDYQTDQAGYWKKWIRGYDRYGTEPVANIASEKEFDVALQAVCQMIRVPDTSLYQDGIEGLSKQIVEAINYYRPSANGSAEEFVPGSLCTPPSEVKEKEVYEFRKTDPSYWETEACLIVAEGGSYGVLREPQNWVEFQAAFEAWGFSDAASTEEAILANWCMTYLENHRDYDSTDKPDWDLDDLR